MSKIPCEIDVDDLDYSLSDIIIKGVSALIQEKDCYPEEMGSDEEWNKVLEEIIVGFKAAQEIYLFNPDAEKELLEKFEKGIDLLKKHFFHLWY
jgi:hypothetical protein